MYKAFCTCEFSRVLRHSNSNCTLFQQFAFFWDTLYTRWCETARISCKIFISWLARSLFEYAQVKIMYSGPQGGDGEGSWGGGHFAHWESFASGAAQLGCITSISASYCSITKQRADRGFQKLFNLIQHLIILIQKSEIDASSPAGKKLENISGDLEFCHVNFAYPRRPAFEVRIVGR